MPPSKKTYLRKTLKAITIHHDAPRMVFTQSEQGKWVQYNRPVSHSDDALYSLQIINLKGSEVNAYESLMKHHVRGIQQNIDLEKGPLLQAGLFRADDGDFLFLTAHHFIVDGISWRVLLEDLATGYRQAVKGEGIDLPPKTSSFKAYTEKLADYAESRQLMKQLAYWREAEEYQAEALPFDQINDQTLNERKRDTVSFSLNTKETEALLKSVNRTYNTDTQDIFAGFRDSSFAGLDETIYRQIVIRKPRTRGCVRRHRCQPHGWMVYRHLSVIRQTRFRLDRQGSRRILGSCVKNNKRYTETRTGQRIRLRCTQVFDPA